MSSITDLLNTNGQSNVQERTSGSFVMGTITENNDKDHPGMVKVSFTAWNKDKNVYEWIPMLSAYAGKEHGVYIQPEVGDVVIVGFVGPGMKTPFILGSLFSNTSTMLKDCAEEKNMNRQLKTKGGILAQLSDESGKESIHVATPKELSVTIEDEKETISIQDKDGSNALVFDCQGGNITLTAKTKITLEAGQSSIEIDGNAGSITIKANQCKLQAQQTVNIEGTQSTTVKGGMLTVEGQQTTAVKSSGPVQVQGAIVQIN